MNYLSVENIGKSFGERILFDNLSFGISKGDKVALIAKNGAGKTTLMNILARRDQPESGNLAFRDGIRIGYLEQDPVLDSKISIKDFVDKAHTHVTKIIREYDKALDAQSKNHDAESQKKLELATAKMDLYNAWDYSQRLEQLLTRFNIRDLTQHVDSLSGGEKKRLALALVLLDEPDLLFMDEPTNHLDIDMIEWLEKHLSRQTITFLMVTHDRYFLDRICSRIIEIDDQGLYQYKGNYEYFLEKKAEREESFKTETEKAKQLMKQELEWMRRMPKARTTKSKSRIGAFYETSEKASRRKDDSSIQLNVKMNRLGSKILELHNVSKKYGELTILKGFNYNFMKGERLGIIGKNGSGKTTLLNLINEKEKPDSGSIVKGETIVYGYYSQDGIIKDEGKRVIDVVKDIAEVIETGDGNVVPAARFLQYFMFTPEMQYTFVSKLSGGEKRRLYLLTVLIRNPNFLILDEPTNDLDLMTLQKLEEFLLDYKGCLVIVSHDRYFLDKLTDHLFIFEGDGEIKDYYGRYAQYKAEKEEAVVVEKGQQVERKKQEKKDNNNTKQSGNKKLSFKERLEYEKLEKEIAGLEIEKKELEAVISSGENDFEKLQEISLKIGEIIRIIDEKSFRWMELDERC